MSCSAGYSAIDDLRWLKPRVKTLEEEIAKLKEQVEVLMDERINTVPFGL